MARRVLANYHRGGVRRQRLGERLRQQIVAAVADPGGEVPERLAVRAALAGLAELDREVLMLTVWEGLRPQEVAELLGVEPAAVLEGVVEVPRRRSRVRRFAGVVTAAAVLVSVVPMSVVMRGQSVDGGVSPIATADAQAVYSPLAVAAAQRHPRLLINRSGWKVTSLYGFVEEHGTVVFRRGGQELEMNWYPASGYAERRTDRLGVGPATSVQVDRWPADLFQYFAGDFAVLVRPRDGVFVEMRTSGNWSRKDLDRLSHTLSGWMRGRGWRRFRRRWSRRWGSGRRRCSPMCRCHPGSMSPPWRTLV
ncbi:sigma factor-like helix-turn-helix DNA-binding protein [Micromonospora sp. NPDC050695]|uniref:RNA polymerase sigma factor n=1 Tax=Micromonospora sp. NPDC050695 TaxID=3154938 RepID=UPI0033C8F849